MQYRHDQESVSWGVWGRFIQARNTSTWWHTLAQILHILYAEQKLKTTGWDMKEFKSALEVTIMAHVIVVLPVIIIPILIYLTGRIFGS